MGNLCDVGSAFLVEEAVRTGKKMSGVLCFDTIGYTSDKKNSQAFPPGMNPEMFQAEKVADATVGDFLAVMGEANSGKLIQSFQAQSSLDSVNLPCACLQVPYRYEQMDVSMRDLLRSDHAPFWKHGVPALFITDTADFRNPYYHTAADTIEKLNFDFLTRICKATVASAVHLTTS